MHAKHFRATLKAIPAPDDATLAKIRRFTLVDIAPESLVVREFVLAHNCIDRDRECFDEALLAAFAASIPGKGCYVRHPNGWHGDGGPAEGRVFDAEIQRMPLEQARAELREPKLTLPPDRDEVHLLVTRAYFVRTPDNAALLLKMDAGIAGDVSVGFTTQNPPVKVFDPEGHEINVRRWQAPGEALEQSLVWLGAQPGARATKSATSEEPTMDYQKLYTDEQAKTADLQAKLEAASTKVTAHQAAADSLAALKAALGEGADDLVASPQKLAAMVADGKAHRKSLIDALVLADRQAHRIGDDEEAVKAAAADYDDLPTKALQRLADALKGSGAAAFGIAGADPGVTRGDGNKAVQGPFGRNPAFGATAAA